MELLIYEMKRNILTIYYVFELLNVKFPIIHSFFLWFYDFFGLWPWL